MQKIKVHGVFRAGSNYAKALLELNYEVKVVNGDGGFKHTPIPAIFEGREWIPPQAPILGMVKDPWAWLVSMWRYVNGVGSQHVICGKTWHQFLRSPLIVFFGGHDCFPKQRFASPVEYWNAMAFNLRSVGRYSLIARYEDLLRDPETACWRIEDQLALERRSGSFVNVPNRTLNMADRARTRVEDYMTEEPFDADYYLLRGYSAQFDRGDRRLVRRQLDENLVEQLGY